MAGWFWICVGMVIAILTVLSGGLFANPISDDCSRQKETDDNAAWRRPLKNELEHWEKVFQIQTAWNPVVNGVACGTGWQRGPSYLCESSAEYRETTV